MRSRVTTAFIDNTLRLPCRAELVTVSHVKEVQEAVRFAQHANKTLLPLGEGSNVVLPPELGARVLKVTDTSLVFLAESAERVTLRVGAGYGWHRLVLKTLSEGLYGLENLALIPGLLGAAPVQNIGAYGREFASFVEAVHTVDLQSGQAQTLSRGECAFAYRDSVFKGELRDRVVITAVDLTLSRTANVHCEYPALAACFATRSEPPKPQEVCSAVIGLREQRLPDPAHEPNVGSFFKNPVVSPEKLRSLRLTHADIPAFVQADERYKIPAAWLIEHAGMRGVEHGPVAVAARHALVLMNRGGGTQSDVLDLAEAVQAAVTHRFDVPLEVEPRVYR